MKILAKFRLWWRGYCTKHGIEKIDNAGPGGLSPYCTQCEKERLIKKAQIIAKSRDILGFPEKTK